MELGLFYNAQDNARKLIAAKDIHTQSLMEQGAERIGTIKVTAPQRKQTIISAIGGIGVPDPDVYAGLRGPLKYLLCNTLNLPGPDHAADIMTQCMMGLERVLVDLHLARTGNVANVLYATAPNPPFKLKGESLYFGDDWRNSKVKRFEYCGTVRVPRIVLNKHLPTPFPTQKEAHVTWRLSKA